MNHLPSNFGGRFSINAATASLWSWVNDSTPICDDTVEKEDFPMSEKLNAGFFTGAQKEVVYGRNEPALIHYHKALRRAMGSRAV